MVEHLLTGLDDDQRLAATTDALPLAIIAPAGSGKTRVLTHRIAWRCATGREDPRLVVAVTFTRSAAAELRQRLRRLGLRDGVRASTIHALARLELAEATGRQPDVLADPLPLLREVAGDLAYELRDELTWARAHRLDPDAYEAAVWAGERRPRSSPERLAAAMRAYAAAKRKARVHDFDDLLEEMIERLDDDRAALRRSWNRHPYVDEFQDVSPLQVEFLRRVVDPGSLCVVGDPNQAIYGFNGSDPTFLRRFEQEFPGSTVVRLRNSYRSDSAILEAAGRALRNAGDRVDVVPVRGHRHLPTVTRCDDADAEAARIARTIVDRHLPGQPWSAQAVLVRTRAQLQPLAEALAAHHVPHRVLGDDGESPALRRALWRLRASKRPFREALAALAAELEESDGSGGDGDDDSDGTGTGDGTVLDGDAGAGTPGDDTIGRFLLAAADDYERAGGRPTTEGFVAWLSMAGVTPTGATGDAGADHDAVTLSTFHGAKGLEWSVVHVAGAEEGLLPGWWATTPEAEAEERRLFYVACTRARDELHLTWAASREVGGRARARTRSRYLDDLVRTLEDVRRLHAPVDGRDRIAAIRRQLRAKMA